jgi:hypothetical protein
MSDMASNDNDRRPTDDKASIALLRRIRAGEHVDFVHGVDVCDAAPEILVANLEPVPGYSSVWYLYCAKKYTNKRGQLSGYRQRAITGGGGASWHPEIGRKNVQGSGGGTFCTFTYGRKHKTEERSTRSVVVVNRLGWKMVEYDDLAEADAASNYVLCKVYRTALAKGKSSLPSSSSSGQNENASSSKPPTAKKRKACGGDHPEAAPASKLIQQQQVEELNVDDIDIRLEMLSDVLSGEPVPEPGMQQPTGARTEHDGRFSIVEELKMLPDEPVAEPGIQHPTDAGTEHDGRFSIVEPVAEPRIQQPTDARTKHDGRFSIVEELKLLPDELVAEPGIQQPTDAETEHGHGSGSSFSISISIEEELNVDDYNIDIMEMMPDEPDHPEATPASLIQQQEADVQQHGHGHGVGFHFEGMQQPTNVIEPEHDDDRSIHPTSGDPLLAAQASFDFEGMQQPTTVAETEHDVRFKVCCSSEHGHGSGSSFSISIEEELNVDDYDIYIMEMMPDDPDHPEATSASLIQQQEADVQQHGHGHGIGFHFEGMQQPTNVIEPEHDDGQSIHPTSGDLLLAAQASFDFEGMQQPTTVTETEHDVRFKVCCSSEHGHGSGSSFSIEEELTVDDYDIDIMEMMPDETDHPEATPASLIQQQEADVQQHGHGHGVGFHFEEMQQPTNVTEPEHDDGRSIHPMSGDPLLAAQASFDFEGMQQPTTVAESEHDDGRSVHPLSGGPVLAAQISYDFEGMQQPTTVAESEHDDGQSIHPLSGGPVLAAQVSFDFEGMQQPTTVAEPEHDDGRSMSIQLRRMCSYTLSGVHTSATKIQRSGLLQGPDDAHSLLF